MHYMHSHLSPSTLDLDRDLSQERLNEMGIKQLAEYRDPYSSRVMTFGEIGCFLSHYRIWEDVRRNRTQTHQSHFTMSNNDNE